MKLNIHYKPPSDEEIEATQDFDALLERYNAEKNIEIKNKTNWRIAASIVLFLSFGAIFAYFLVPYLDSNSDKFKIKKRNITSETNSEISIFDSLKLEPQWFKLDNYQTQIFETKAGLGFVFDKKSFKNTNSVLVNISEVTDSVLLYKYFMNHKIALFITFFDANTKQPLETTKPIKVNTKWQKKLLFNPDLELKNKWINIENKATDIEKLDKNTIDYIEYSKAKAVLDSIKTNDELLKKEDKIVFNFSKEYLLKLTEFVSNYEKNINYKTNIKNALENLKKYNEQHTILIQKTDILNQYILINKKGWWALR
ncbi:MAG: hypothetical protein EAZ53_14310 [Bacteroidetes bacterium]|nr:MAG: hypothetical protein EAZ53_14310 [Bacteroidota bacterium]